MADGRLLLDDDRFLLAPRAEIPGSDGVDTLLGSPGPDQIAAGGGNDIVDGLGGADLILGQGGDDTLRGSSGADEIRGGVGADTIEGNGGPDVIDGGAGNDRIDGNEGDDVLRGNQGDDTIAGGSGNDQLAGGGGTDKLDGNSGADTLAGGLGNDTLGGNGGDDVLGGGRGDDVLAGGVGDDELRGGAGNDTIEGNAGRDTIDGLDGSDKLAGNGGGDLVRGGRDGDTISGGNGDDDLRGGAGDDTIDGDGGNDTLDGGNGNDVLRGGAGNDTARGSVGDDQIEGGAGADRLFGGGGNDEMLGDDGADRLTGGAGDDILDGGRGPDRLEGGAGLDIFRFSSVGATVDTVADFVEGADALDLAPILPDFEAGDRLNDFVRFRIEGDDTVVAVDQDGLDGNFVDLALLVGVQIDSLPPEDLGLPEAPVSGLPTEPTLVSTNAGGVVANGLAFLPSISADGQFVAFASSATNLGSDGGPGIDVFRKDLITGEVVLVRSDSDKPAISADGGIVAVRSFGGGAISVVDLENGGGNTLGGTDQPSITADGSLVAFEDNEGGARTAIVAESATGDVVLSIPEVGEANPIRDTLGTSRLEISPEGDFLAYADEGQILLRSVIDTTEIPVTAPGAVATHPDVASNARFVAFESATSLVAEDTNGVIDIYRAEIDTETNTVLALELISTAENGDLGNGGSINPSISDDGRLIAFRSFADNLVDADANGIADIFVKDVTTGQVQRIELSDDTSGVIPQRSFFAAPDISGDGQFVAYTDQIEIQSEELVDGQVFVAPVVFAPPALATIEAPTEPLAA